MSYTASYFHVVFGTKKRKPSLSLLHKEELRRYIYGIAENMKCDIEWLVETTGMRFFDGSFD